MQPRVLTDGSGPVRLIQFGHPVLKWLGILPAIAGLAALSHIARAMLPAKPERVHVVDRSVEARQLLPAIQARRAPINLVRTYCSIVGNFLLIAPALL